MNTYASYIDYALQKTESFPKNIVSKGGTTIYLKDHQLFVARVFLGLNTLNSLLLFHDTGFGKTLTSVYMFNHLKDIYSDWVIILLVKKALIEDPWISTISSYAYDVLKKCVIINYDDQNFHNKFFTNIKGINIKTRIFIVIDECHNFISKSLTKQDNKKRNTKLVYNYISKNMLQNNNKLLCLSATPIVNDSKEFQLLMNLLRPGVLQTSQSVFYNKKIVNEKELVSKLGCICSYIVNNEVSIFDDVESSDAFAKKNVYIKRIDMSEKQEELYAKAKYIEKKMGIGVFKIYQRMAATFVFDDIPDKKKLTEKEYNDLINNMSLSFIKVVKNKKFSKKSLNALRRGDFITDENDAMLYNYLYEHSCKFTYVCVSVLQSKGKCLIFEPFIKLSGIVILLQYLEVFDITYIEFSSRTRDTRVKKVEAFNDKNNINGERLKVCVFSQSGGEGISFLSINDIFILDMTWNEASLKQIIGRAIRLNSHIDNSPDRRYVNVYFIVAKSRFLRSVDETLLDIIQLKSNEFSQLYKILKHSSIEWIYNHYTPFQKVTDEKEFKNLITRQVIFDENVVTLKKKIIVGENIWYSFSTSLTSILKGFKSEDNKIYDDNGFFVSLLPEQPVIKIYKDKLVYVLSNK